jgi:hypothetical protein
MSIETMKCAECGSAEVTEFKPGSYICGHCEGIFKHVPDQAQSATLCPCGIEAAIRCAHCDTAVCRQHFNQWWQGNSSEVATDDPAESAVWTWRVHFTVPNYQECTLCRAGAADFCLGLWREQAEIADPIARQVNLIRMGVMPFSQFQWTPAEFFELFTPHLRAISFPTTSIESFSRSNWKKSTTLESSRETVWRIGPPRGKGAPRGTVDVRASDGFVRTGDTNEVNRSIRTSCVLWSKPSSITQWTDIFTHHDHKYDVSQSGVQTGLWFGPFYFLTSLANVYITFQDTVRFSDLTVKS